MTNASMSSDSFNLVSSSSTFLDVPPPIGETFHDQLPPNNSLKYGYSTAGTTLTGFGSNISTTASIPIEVQSQRHPQYGKQSYGQYSSNAFTALAASAPPPHGGGLGGPVSQVNDQVSGIDSRSNGNGAPPSMQHNRGTERSTTELRIGSREEFPSGYAANNGYDSLDDLMNGMMKREQDPTTIMMDGEFGFDPYSFGSCI